MDESGTCLESEIFALVAGSKHGIASEQQRRVSMHAAVLARLSPALAALVSNGMRETHSLKVVFPEFEPSTLAAFSVYAYTGRYTLRRGSHAASSSETRHIDDSHSVVTGLARWCTACGAAYAETRNRPKWGLGSCSEGYCFSHRTFPVCLSLRYCTFCRREAEADCERSIAGTTCCEAAMLAALPTGNFPRRRYAVESHTDCGVQIAGEHSLLEHAKLYTFAQQWMVEPLMKLCLQNLHKDLLLLRLTAEGVDEVVELLKYTYATMEGSAGDLLDKSGIDSDLRDLIVAYACWKEDDLVDSPKVQELMKEHRQFFADFSNAIATKTECVLTNGIHS
jgi:hypothetical protein